MTTAATTVKEEPQPKERRGRRAKEQSTGNTLAEKFARHLRTARLEAGWTLEDAVQATGGFLEVSDWSRYESGAEPRLSAIFAICTALGLTFEQLLSGVMPKEPKKRRRTA